MSFLAPLFLLGAAAIGLPVLFHLIRRSPRVQRAFSSLMFLDASTPRLTRRSRLEHLLLLLLRCGVICLLAFAFARPFLNRPVPESVAGDEAREFVLLLDTSASMQRSGLWQAARARVEELASQCRAADQLAVFTYDQRVVQLVSFEDWNTTPSSDRVGLLRGRLNKVEPGWFGTSLDNAIIQVTEMLADGDEPSAFAVNEIVLITDYQEGSQVADLQSYEWPKGITVRTELLTPSTSGNASLQWLADGTTDEGLVVRLRVSNADDSKQAQFQVGWAAKDGGEFAGEPQEVYVPAGQSRVVTLLVDAVASTTRVARLTGDSAPFDNQVFVIPPVRAQLKVAYLGSDPSGDPSSPLYFLKRALPDTPGQQIKVIPINPESTSGGELPEDTTLVVATGALGETMARRVQSWLESGGTVLFAPADAQSSATLARLLGVGQLSLTEYSPRDYAMLGAIDFWHPLFAPFADERFSDFTGVHFWKYRRIDTAELPGVHVLARFDNDDPAMIEAPVGKGRLILLASGWVPADSQLALSSKFVPLLFSLLELTGKASAPDSQWVVGDRLPLDLQSNAPITVLGVDGTVTALEGLAGSQSEVVQPGLYTIQSTEGLARFAVNLDPRESRTAPLPVDELERLGVPSPKVAPDPVRTAEHKVALHKAELEARQQIWRWLIATTLVLLLIETWLSGWTLRRTQTTEPSTA